MNNRFIFSMIRNLFDKPSRWSHEVPVYPVLKEQECSCQSDCLDKKKQEHFKEAMRYWHEKYEKIDKTSLRPWGKK